METLKQLIEEQEAKNQTEFKRKAVIAELKKFFDGLTMEREGNTEFKYNGPIAVFVRVDDFGVKFCYDSFDAHGNEPSDNDWEYERFYPFVEHTGAEHILSRISGGCKEALERTLYL